MHSGEELRRSTRPGNTETVLTKSVQEGYVNAEQRNGKSIAKNQRTLPGKKNNAVDGKVTARD